MRMKKMSDKTTLIICKGLIEICDLLSQEENFNPQQKKRLLQQKRAFEGLSKLYESKLGTPIMRKR